jgi:hypothetical protein
MSTYKVFTINFKTFVVARQTIEQPGRVPTREWLLIEVNEYNNGVPTGQRHPLSSLARTRAAVEDELILAGHSIAREVDL